MMISTARMTEKGYVSQVLCRDSTQVQSRICDSELVNNEGKSVL